MPSGRPTDYSQDLSDRICEWLAGGQSLRSFCKQDDAPGLSTVSRWVNSNEEFKKRYNFAVTGRQSRTGAALPLRGRSPKSIPSHVYIMSLAGTDLYKIGVASNVPRRACQIQTASPFEVVIIASFRGGMSLEKSVHNFVEHFNVRGEWYELSANALTSLIKICSCWEGAHGTT